LVQTSRKKKRHHALRGKARGKRPRTYRLSKEQQAAARQRLIADWATAGGPQSPQSHLIFVGTNQEAEQYNLLAQQERRRVGQLQQQHVTVDETTYYLGDRLMFVKKSRRLGIENGDTGTIVAARRLAVEALEPRPPNLASGETTLPILTPDFLHARESGY